MKGVMRAVLCILLFGSFAAFTTPKIPKKTDTEYIKHMKLAQEHADSGYFNLAQEEYAKCTNIEPSKPGAYYNLGLLLLSQKKFSDAETVFKILIQKAPKDEDAYCFTALALFEQMKTKEALKYATKTFSLNSFDSRNNFALAPFIIKAGLVEEGLKCIDRGIVGMEDEKYPENLRMLCAKSIFLKAQTYEDIKQYNFAIQSLYYFLGNMNPNDKMVNALSDKIEKLSELRAKVEKTPSKLKHKESAFKVAGAIYSNSIASDMVRKIVFSRGKTSRGITTSVMPGEDSIQMLTMIISGQSAIWGNQPKDMDPYYSATIKHIFNGYLEKDSFVVSFSNGSRESYVLLVLDGDKWKIKAYYLGGGTTFKL